MANASGYELAELSTWLQDAGLPAPTSLRGRERARRALNVAVAALGLILAAPLVLAIAIAIKLTSRGPLFYTQTRIGIDVRDPLIAGGNGRRKRTPAADRSGFTSSARWRPREARPRSGPDRMIRA